MTWLERFEALETTGLGAAVRDSIWLFPAIEAVHLVAIASLAGAVLLVDLRLLGFGLRSRPVAELGAAAAPWFWTSLAALFATGVPLFLSEAVKCYWNTSFWVKMTALAGAIVFTVTLRRVVVRSARGDDEGRFAERIVGAASLGLWFTVAAAGRWIGFS